MFHPSYLEDPSREVYEQMMAVQPFEDKVFELLKKYLLPLIGKEISIIGTPPVLNEKKFLKLRKKAKKAEKAGNADPSPELEGPEPDLGLLIYSDEDVI